MYMNRRKWEQLVLSGVVALIAAVGIFFGILCLFHIDVMDCDPAKTAMRVRGPFWQYLVYAFVQKILTEMRLFPIIRNNVNWMR